MMTRAIHSFLDQDYPGRIELMIDDDSEAGPWSPCMCLDARQRAFDPHLSQLAWARGREDRWIRYGWRSDFRTCAQKRNTMMRSALNQNVAGTVFALWDDDDLHGPQRLRHQVAALREHPEAEVCLLSGWILYEERRHLAVRASGAVADGTAVFTVAHWDRAPWNEEVGGWDGPARLTYQMTRAPESIVRVDAPLDYVVVRHETNNTSAPGASYRGGVWKLPCPLSADEVASMLRTELECRSPRSG